MEQVTWVNGVERMLRGAIPAATELRPTGKACSMRTGPLGTGIPHPALGPSRNDD